MPKQRVKSSPKTYGMTRLSFNILLGLEWRTASTEQGARAPPKYPRDGRKQIIHVLVLGLFWLNIFI